jgi:acetylornithine deacetylase/succinyl-diaminopimelate desuccinylase-like protein
MSTEELRADVRGLMPQAKRDLAELVSMRSVADPDQFPPEECERAAQWLIDAFSKVGLRDLAAHETPDGSKAVFGQAPAPPGAPTVLLYCHYDVQPPLDDDGWETPVFELTEKDGRWYGRGSADCKGNVVMHLTALRALGGGAFPVGVKLIAEGSEEQGTGGLEAYARRHPDLLRADTILICDAGNSAVGVPTLTTTLRGIANVVVTVQTLRSAMHSGMFGGAAPDALQAMIQILSTLRDEHGNTTVRGLDNTQRWDGVQYPSAQFRADATLLDGIDPVGSGTIADMLWARPALTVLGIDAPSVVGSAAAIQPRVRARLNLRVPPGMQADQALQALTAHVKAVTPWNAKVEVESQSTGEPFVGSTEGPGFESLKSALQDAYGHALTSEGQGGSIPLCNALAEIYPDAEIMLMGVEEPRCLIHAANESVDPSEIENMALAEALFLRRYADAGSRSRAQA